MPLIDEKWEEWKAKFEVKLQHFFLYSFIFAQIRTKNNSTKKKTQTKKLGPTQTMPSSVYCYNLRENTRSKIYSQKKTKHRILCKN